VVQGVWCIFTELTMDSETFAYRVREAEREKYSLKVCAENYVEAYESALGWNKKNAYRVDSAIVLTPLKPDILLVWSRKVDLP